MSQGGEFCIPRLNTPRYLAVGRGAVDDQVVLDTLKLVRPTNLVGPYRQARPSGCTTPLH